MKVMLLAAGRGTRMSALTASLPKPLLIAGGKPLIAWHLERLAHTGLREVVINHAYLGHLIEQALGDGSRFGLNIQYSPEAAALETAGGIAWALPLLGVGPFAVINADAFNDYDYAALSPDRLGSSSLAHLVMVRNPPQHLGGDFYLHEHKLTDHASSPYVETRLTFSGIGIYRPELFDGIARGTKQALAPLLRQAMHREQVSGELHSGYWIDVGTPERLTELELHLKSRAV
jgi:N-acetyl-alpha-D-muramate 1-phosphate uridylyltransferase